jgi:PAS domain S-box-containing protein
MKHSAIASPCFRRFRVTRMGFLPLLALVFATADSSAQPATEPSATLTNIQQVVELGLERAQVEHLPVQVEGVVTFLTRRNDEMFIHDATAGVVVRHTNLLNNRFAGQRVRVSGELQAGLLAPFINRARVEVLGTAPMPEPLRVPLARLHAGEFPARWVEVNGVIRDVVQEEDFFILFIRSGGSRIPVFAMSTREKRLPLEWLDAPVVVKGVAWPEVDREGKHIGTWIHVATTDFLSITPPAHTNVFAQPVLSLGTSPQLQRLSDTRLKVAGTVLYQSPSGRVFFRDETGAAQAELLVPLVRSTAWAKLVPRSPAPRLQPGDRIELVGAPTEATRAPLLVDAEFRLLGQSSTSPKPTVINTKAALSGKYDGDLVTLRAKVVARDSRTAGRLRHEILALEDDGTFFEALAEMASTNGLPEAPENTVVEVTGLITSLSSSAWPSRSFRLWLRDPVEVRLLGHAPWWESLQPARILAVSGGLGALALVWIGLLRRQIAQRKQAEAATRTINYFATSLLERNTEEEILWDLARNCVAQFGFVDCVVYLLDRKENVLLQKAAYGPKNPTAQQILNPITIPLGQGIVGSVAATGRAEIVADTRKDPRYILDDERRLSELTVPIVVNNRVLGVIDSEHPKENFFTRKHLEILTSIASLCANKLVRVRAEQKLRTLNTRLEQRVAEGTAELRESEAKYRALFEGGSIAVVVHDEQQILDCNPATLRIFGYATREEIVGKHPAQISAPTQPDGEDSMTAAKRHMAEALSKGFHQFEWLSQRGDGTPVPVEIVLTPMQLSGRAVIQAQVRDITERKRAEAELLQSYAREKELSELKSRFVSTVSHEFRTPLGIIMASAEILEAYFERLPPAERHSNLQDITDATRHMSRMMDEVLLLGRVEAGKMTCRPAPLDLSVFCQRLVDEVDCATNSRCPIRLTTAPSLSEANADENLLRHIFINLLTNAVKYSPAGGRVEFELAARAHLALFTVRDRGIGIPEADARLLFQAFHRGRNVGDRSGTGLGMTIVKRCVELHGGKIGFESKEGLGTTFIVALPLLGAAPGGNGDQTTQFIRAAATGRNITFIP